MVSGKKAAARQNGRDSGDERHGDGDSNVRGERVRLDKWLWAARFFKTRALAVDEIERNRVSVNELPAKPAREVRPGDAIAIRQGPVTRTVVVRGLSSVRGSAPVAQALYEETAASVAERERLAAQRRMGVEPAQAIEQGRPTKRDRRQLAEWQRWSASASSDDEPR